MNLFVANSVFGDKAMTSASGSKCKIKNIYRERDPKTVECCLINLEKIDINLGCLEDFSSSLLLQVLDLLKQKTVVVGTVLCLKKH